MYKVLFAINFLRRYFLPTVFICALTSNAFGNETIRETAQPVSSALLIEKLRGGGYNLYVRHAATDWSQSDRIEVHGDWVSCDPKKVRQLSEKGRREARTLGQGFRSLGIRLGRVYASPYCRTMETARLISGKKADPTTDLMNLRAESFVGGRKVIIARARTLLSRLPATGVNDLFAAHGNLGRAATGRYLDEGEVLVLAPRGNGQFNIVGTLTPENLKTFIDKERN